MRLLQLWRAHGSVGRGRRRHADGGPAACGRARLLAGQHRRLVRRPLPRRRLLVLARIVRQATAAADARAEPGLRRRLGAHGRVRARRKGVVPGKGLRERHRGGQRARAQRRAGRAQQPSAAGHPGARRRAAGGGGPRHQQADLRLAAQAARPRQAARALRRAACGELSEVQWRLDMRQGYGVCCVMTNVSRVCCLVTCSHWSTWSWGTWECAWRRQRQWRCPIFLFIYASGLDGV
mmetsp:Transcript_22829/g.72444  ORF Transcript_22829/g.72444 Transcript_22829/m.72444 type:complete len:236 (-) Transcript_22829:11-718(-)